jgi:hypothetical protein
MTARCTCLLSTAVVLLLAQGCGATGPGGPSDAASAVPDGGGGPDGGTDLGSGPADQRGDRVWPNDFDPAALDLPYAGEDPATISCNQLENTAPLVRTVRIGDPAPPVFTGGTLRTGTYHLVEAQWLEALRAPNEPEPMGFYRRTMVISEDGRKQDFVTLEAVDGQYRQSRITAALTIRGGTMLSAARTCGIIGMTSYQFTAAADSLVVLVGTSRVLRYQRVGD